MAHQSVSQCRFYIDNISWLKSLGLGFIHEGLPYNTETNNVFGLNVSDVFVLDTTLIDRDDGYAALRFHYNNPLEIPYNFYAVLGHKLVSSQQANYHEDSGFMLYDESISQAYYLFEDNEVATSINSDISYDGFSLIAYKNAISEKHNFLQYAFYRSGDQVVDGSIQVGKVIAGMYYDMPHSPDMSLTLGYETGTKTIETRGGSSLSNTMWRPPMWNNLAPWTLHDPDSGIPVGQTLAHSSRRTWDLNFSYLSKENTFPKYNALNRLADMNETVPDDETLLTSDDFFSQVWNRVGTALPFIFQPDTDANEFAIVKIADKSLKVKQVSNQIYNIKLKLRETF